MRTWHKRTLALSLGWITLCTIGALTTDPPPLARWPEPTDQAEARLLCAPLPAIGLLAVHCWLNVRPTHGPWQRWEVWQEHEAGGTAWGHVHKNLADLLDDVGGDPPTEYARLTGDAADTFARCLQEHAPRYPHRDTYRAWPGPNSNTFIDHLLRTCHWPTTLPTTAIGKDWRGFVGASTTTTATGVQLETPLIGLRAGLDEGVELHVLTLAFGLDLWPPATLTPFGRFGFPER